jgi:hypothetical protein
MPQPNRIAPAQARTFEVQRRSGDRWLLDSVADDKQIAINLANSLLKSGQARLGVQVVAVLHTEDGQFKEVRVYRATPQDQRDADSGPPRPQPGTRRKLQIDRVPEELRRESRRGAPTAKPKLGVPAAWASFRRVTWPTWAAVGFVLAWCACFYVWRQPQTPWAFDSAAAQRSSPKSNTLESKFPSIFPQH